LQNITTCLWFNNDAEAAARLYTSIFANGKVENPALYGEAGENIPHRPAKDTVMTVPFKLNGRDFLGLNGGPAYKFTPAISFFVDCNTEEEFTALFKTLSEKGSVLMPMAKYPFSERFAWVTDRFGVSWQLNLAHHPQKIMPFLMFNGKQFGKAEEAMRFYMSQFEDSHVVKLVHAKSEDTGIEGLHHAPEYVQQAIFTLHGEEFRVIDSPVEHTFGFTPGTSFMVNCETQAEIDRLWSALSAGGGEVQCGWLYDQYGVSWQIVPTALGQLMGKGNRAKNDAMMRALLKMVKLDIADLKTAYDRG